MFGRVIFGDNQFLGVNHSNQKKAAEIFQRFSQTDEILYLLGTAYDCGVRDFMFTPHDRYDDVFNEIRRSNLFQGMYFTPCLPYAHKYWNKLSEHGPIHLLSSTLLKVGLRRLIPATLTALLGQKQELIHLLTDIEIFASKGLPLRGVFLQNLAFDFLVAMELYSFIDAFSDVVTGRLGVLPGFITMNHTCAVEVLCDRLGMTMPWVCANYNLAGFRMNPTPEICRNSFASLRSNNIAMSVFSANQGNPQSALDFIKSKYGLGGVASVLFGSSNPVNIRENVYALSD